MDVGITNLSLVLGAALALAAWPLFVASGAELWGWSIEREGGDYLGEVLIGERRWSARGESLTRSEAGEVVWSGGAALAGEPGALEAGLIVVRGQRAIGTSGGGVRPVWIGARGARRVEAARIELDLAREEIVAFGIERGAIE